MAILKINKAQFGTAVWLNGKPIGEHLGCFTAGYFDLDAAPCDWQGENELVVRIGAHPAVLPATAPAGTDNEKLKWTPGIYDSVSLILADNPVIESVQVAPRLASSEILVADAPPQLRPADRSFTLTQTRGGRPLGNAEDLRSQPAKRRRCARPSRIPSAKLWTPEHAAILLHRSDDLAPAATPSPRASACASSASTPPPGAPT